MLKPAVSLPAERRRGAPGRGNPEPSGMMPSGMVPILDRAVGEPVAHVQVLRTKGRRDRLGSVFQLPDSTGLGGRLARALAGNASREAAMVDAVDATKEVNKEKSGRLATFIWIASGVYLFSSTPHASFLSWQAAVFFVAGMFAAAILLGSLFYFITTMLTGMFSKLAGRSPISPMLALAISFTGLLLFISNVAGSFIIARWVFHVLVG